MRTAHKHSNEKNKSDETNTLTQGTRASSLVTFLAAINCSMTLSPINAIFLTCDVGLMQTSVSFSVSVSLSHKPKKGESDESGGLDGEKGG